MNPPTIFKVKKINYPESDLTKGFEYDKQLYLNQIMCLKAVLTKNDFYVKKKLVI
jgi:hypothetical protein